MPIQSAVFTLQQTVDCTGENICCLALHGSSLPTFLLDHNSREGSKKLVISPC